MLKSFWHNILAICLVFIYLVDAVDYGVGFSLSLGYG